MPQKSIARPQKCGQEEDFRHRAFNGLGDMKPNHRRESDAGGKGEGGACPPYEQLLGRRLHFQGIMGLLTDLTVGANLRLLLRNPRRGRRLFEIISRFQTVGESGPAASACFAFPRHRKETTRWNWKEA